MGAQQQGGRVSAQPELDFVGAVLRDQGIKTVLSKNEEWRQRFFIAAQRILSNTGSVTSEQVVADIGLPDGNPSATGGAMRAFALANGLRIVGYVKSMRSSRHCGAIAIWAQTAL
jgi:hypothetical protein